MTKKLYKKIAKKLKEEKGASMTLMNMSFLLVLFLFIITMSTMISLFSLIIQSRSLIEEATVKTIQNNYANVYHTSRESYSGGYIPNEINFSESIMVSKKNIYNTLLNSMGFKKGDKNICEKLDKNNNLLYSIKDINLKIINENIKSGTQNFTAEVEYTFVFPIKIFNYKKDLEIGMLVKAKHTGKF